MNLNFRAVLDKLSKMDAKTRLPSGGTQYTMEVALGPMASAKNQALMRIQRTMPTETMQLKQLQQKTV